MKACRASSAPSSRARIDADGGACSRREDYQLPVLPLHQDLSMVSALGLPHVERNGHHYFLGQSTSPMRSARAQATHSTLSPLRGLLIDDGRLDLSSLAVGASAMGAGRHVPRRGKARRPA